MRTVVRNKRELLDQCDIIRSSFIEEGRDYIIVFEPVAKKRIRSIRQNRLFHMWLKYLYIENGSYSPEDWKIYFKQRFLIVEEKWVNNVPMNVIPSTSDLDTVQFTEFLNAVHQDVLDSMGINLPWPEDQRFDEFYTKVESKFIV